jgi:hypothetical protein
MDGLKLHALVYRGDLRTILAAARGADDVAVRKDATAFTNELIARGFTQFRDLLSPPSQPSEPANVPGNPPPTPA